MARLDSYDKYPEGMSDYLSFYGWHFSKKMALWAVDNMYKTVNGEKVKITPFSKEKVDSLLKDNDIRIARDSGYDAYYVANMCKADYLGDSIRNEQDVAKFVGNTLNDPDGYEGMVFTRFYADCIGSGKPIIWEDMI